MSEFEMMVMPGVAADSSWSLAADYDLGPQRG